MAANPRRQPKQARSKQKVDRILAAARDLLARGGAPAFNTNRIAGEAGVGIGSLYEYFPNKQAIVSRLIDDLADSESDAILDRLAEIGDGPPLEAIEIAVALIVAMYRENRPLYRALWALSSDPREVGHRPGEKLIMGEIRKRLEPVAEPLGIRDLDLTCFTVFHIVESLAEQMAAQPPERWGDEAGAAEIVAVVTRYLGLHRLVGGPPP